jgi:predicted PurR-regulated permease PerM
MSTSPIGEKFATAWNSEKFKEVWESDIGKDVQSWLGSIAPAISSWFIAQVTKVASWFGLIVGVAMVPVYLFYLLLEKSGIKKSWTDYLPVHESRAKEESVFIINSINDYLILFFRGQVLVALCDGVMLTIGFLLIGLNYAVLLGMVAGLLTIVPFLGVAISIIPAILIAVVQFNDWLHPALVLGLFALVQFIEGFFVSPKIMGDRVGLHPLTIILAVMIGTTLMGGIIGGILAIPLTAALRVLMFRYIWTNREAPASLTPTGA